MAAFEEAGIVFLPAEDQIAGPGVRFKWQAAASPQEGASSAKDAASH